MLLRTSALIPFLLWVVPTISLVNVTIDDEFGDSRSKFVPQYTPGEQWTQGARCSGCAIHPGIVNVSKAFKGTWHDATYHPGQPAQIVTLMFNGVAIYVFNIIPNNVDGATTLTNLSFFLDEVPVGQFLHIPDQTANIRYHVPVFVNESLPDTQHSLDIRATGPNASLVLFDYAIYTSTTDTNNSTSTSPSSTKRDAIIGGVVGGVGGFLAVLVLVLIYRRRSRNRRKDTQDGDTIEQTAAGPVHIPVLPGAADEFRPRPYPPPSDSDTTPSTARSRAGAKGPVPVTSITGTGTDTPSQPPSSTLPSVSGPSVQEDLAAIRQELARLREQQDVLPMDSLPPQYEAEEHE